METTRIENPIYQKPLRKGHSLTILDKNQSDVIQVRNAKGIVLFTIEVNEQGTNLNINAENINIKATNNLNIKATNNLNIEAKTVSIESKDNTKITTNADFKQFTKGDAIFLTEGEKIDTAKSQTIKSELGNVDLKANDDVTLKGERVKLN